MATPATSTPYSLKLTQGGRTVIVSGVFHVSPGDECEVQVDTLRFAFQFLTDDGDPRYESEIVDDRYLIKLFNHRNALTEGVFQPIEVATLRGQTVAFTYCTNTLGDGDTAVRRLEYVFTTKAPK